MCGIAVVWPQPDPVTELGAQSYYKDLFPHWGSRYYKLDGLTNKYFFFIFLEAGSPRLRCRQGSVESSS